MIRTGQVSEREIPDLVAAMDVGLLPYVEAPPAWYCPLKLVEYRAQGVPVLDARTSGRGAWVAMIPGLCRTVAVARSWTDVMAQAIA